MSRSKKTNPAVTKAIESVGSLTGLADKLEIKYQRIQHWKNGRVPAEWVLPLHRATDGVVSCHEIRPDLYPEEAA